MNFPNTSDETFEKFFVNVLDHSRKDNTYKFALARFLLEYSKNHVETHVQFSTIAEHFLKYYWHMECKSKLKQAPQTNKKPEMTQIIQKYFGTTYYPQAFTEIKSNESDKIQKCIDEITKKCFHNVTWRFQKIRYGKTNSEMKIIFDYQIKKTGHSNKKWINLDEGIDLNPKAIQFFKKYNTTLSKAIILEWARFLEKLNPGIPELIRKTEGELVHRTSLIKYRKALQYFFKNCFYCQKPLSQGKETHVDHVIPFDYIAEDKMWNLALACKNCNCKKLGSLPPEKYLTNLINRNHDYREKIPILDKSLVALGSRFEQTIQDHYKNANLQGYEILSDDDFP